MDKCPKCGCFMTDLHKKICTGDRLAAPDRRSPCVWTLDKDGQHNAECGVSSNGLLQAWRSVFIYCPHCGRKIVEGAGAPTG